MGARLSTHPRVEIETFKMRLNRIRSVSKTHVLWQDSRSTAPRSERNSTL